MPPSTADPRLRNGTMRCTVSGSGEQARPPVRWVCRCVRKFVVAWISCLSGERVSDRWARRRARARSGGSAPPRSWSPGGEGRREQRSFAGVYSIRPRRTVPAPTASASGRPSKILPFRYSIGAGRRAAHHSRSELLVPRRCMWRPTWQARCQARKHAPASDPVCCPLAAPCHVT